MARIPGGGGGSDSKYTVQLGDRICELISGGMTLPKALSRMREDDPDAYVPDRATVFRWRVQHEGFREAYAIARAMQAECLVDDADDAASVAKDRDSAAAARVIADTKLRVAGLLDPKRWGVRQTVVGDRNADPIQTEGTLQVTILRDPPAGHAE